MKKIILLLILCALIALSVFVYEKEYGYKNKELDFSTVLNKEYSYIKDDIKTTITIEFDETKVYGYSGVNRYFAGYKVENSNDIQFSPIGSTMMTGPVKDVKMEIEYLALLNNVNKVEVYQDELILKTMDNQVLKFIENKEGDIGSTTSQEVTEQSTEDKNVVIGEEANLPKAE